MMIAFYVSICLLIFFAGLKCFLHLSLDYSNGYKIAFARSRGLEYFLPYDKEVRSEDEKKKRICNRVQKIMIFSLCLFILCFILKNYLIKL